jgi:hypothetical protein
MRSALRSGKPDQEKGVVVVEAGVKGRSAITKSTVEDHTRNIPGPGAVWPKSVGAASVSRNCAPQDRRRVRVGGQRRVVQHAAVQGSDQEHEREDAKLLVADEYRV